MGQKVEGEGRKQGTPNKQTKKGGRIFGAIFPFHQHDYNSIIKRSQALFFLISSSEVDFLVFIFVVLFEFSKELQIFI